ncbi:MAG: hypothetical protein HeimC3_19730 [Candidatus Heimdallarchaeota archaeon LC_3]|nr:MAG: hypothetical protein HeimC3_19730 [Candidatus Heimdallarchaeota archaeon LC_3]
MTDVLNLWILNNSGLCLLHRNFSGGETIDETLFGGFLTAIVHMTKDMHIGQEKNVSIEKISMGSTDIHYRSIDGVQAALVLSVNRKKDKEVEKIINTLVKEFSSRFKGKIDIHMPVRTSDFSSFENVIDSVLKSEGKSIEVTEQETDFQSVLNDIKNGIIKDTSDGIDRLFDLYDKLESVKAKEMISKSMKDVEKLVKSSEILSKEQKSLFKKIIKGASALMKGEKFLMEF